VYQVRSLQGQGHIPFFLPYLRDNPKTLFCAEELNT
jgi:hypothetical protein